MKNVMNTAIGSTNRASVAPLRRRRTEWRRMRNRVPDAKPVRMGEINHEHTMGTTPL